MILREPHHTVRLSVNSQTHTIDVPVRKTLADALREELRLTGTHLGCEHGVCGACTVLVDGLSVRSCLMLAVQAEGSEITTVEGLAQDPALRSLREAFITHGALQCGFCTPGFLVLAAELLRHATPWAPLTQEQLKTHLAANLCRCTGYQPILDAVQQAAASDRGDV